MTKTKVKAPGPGFVRAEYPVHRWMSVLCIGQTYRGPVFECVEHGHRPGYPNGPDGPLVFVCLYPRIEVMGWEG